MDLLLIMFFIYLLFFYLPDGLVGLAEYSERKLCSRSRVRMGITCRARARYSVVPSVGTGRWCTHMLHDSILRTNTFRRHN
jgi:hypothetical protein